VADLTARVLRPSDNGLFGTLFLPRRDRPVGAAVLIGGSGGSEPSYVARPLAAGGIVALSVAYFARPGLPPELRGVPLEYFRDALRFVIDVLPCRDVPVLALGMSSGSEAALLTAARFPDLVDGVVVTVPSNIALGGLPSGGAAWFRQGRPLPYSENSGPDCENPDAFIPAELVHGPILLISAGADEIWPSAAMARALSARLDARGHSFGHRILEYPAASHSLGYLVPKLPPGLLPAGVADPPASQEARVDAWRATVAFIGECRAAKWAPR
jgi:uncharacterized protein